MKNTLGNSNNKFCYIDSKIYTITENGRHLNLYDSEQNWIGAYLMTEKDEETDYTEIAERIIVATNRVKPDPSSNSIGLWETGSSGEPDPSTKYRHDFHGQPDL